jgi:hypothetical protein
MRPINLWLSEPECETYGWGAKSDSLCAKDRVGPIAFYSIEI